MSHEQDERTVRAWFSLFPLEEQPAEDDVIGPPGDGPDSEENVGER